MENSSVGLKGSIDSEKCDKNTGIKFQSRHKKQKKSNITTDNSKGNTIDVSGQHFVYPEKHGLNSKPAVMSHSEPDLSQLKKKPFQVSSNWKELVKV